MRRAREHARAEIEARAVHRGIDRAARFHDREHALDTVPGRCHGLGSPGRYWRAVIVAAGVPSSVGVSLRARTTLRPWLANSGLLETSGPVKRAPAGSISTAAVAMSVPAGELSGIFASFTASVTFCATLP